jgi:hypothetical protein
MPATPDHKVAVHQLARERVEAGKPVWAQTIDVSAVFHTDMPFPEWRDTVVRILRASKWMKDAEEYSDLAEAVEELSDTADLADFNLVWAAIYDLADYDRVWIITR